MVGCSTPYMKVVGMTVPDAIEFLMEFGISDIRATSVDGKPRIGTADWVPTRLNVAIEDGVITAVSGVG